MVHRIPQTTDLNSEEHEYWNLKRSVLLRHLMNCTVLSRPTQETERQLKQIFNILL